MAPSTPPAAEERGIGGVHDRVRLHLRDVAQGELDAQAADATRDSLEGVHHVFERGLRIDLRRRPGAEKRLDVGQVFGDQLALGGRLAVVVRLPRGHPCKDHVRGGAEQHDRVEPRIELALVRHAARDEQRSVVVAG